MEARGSDCVVQPMMPCTGLERSRIMSLETKFALLIHSHLGSCLLALGAHIVIFHLCMSYRLEIHVTCEKKNVTKARGVGCNKQLTLATDCNMLELQALHLKY